MFILSSLIDCKSESGPVAERQWKFAFGVFFVALAQQAEKLRLKRGFQKAVVLSFMKDEEVILSCAGG